jgi:hypothetical protein
VISLPLGRLCIEPCLHSGRVSLVICFLIGLSLSDLLSGNGYLGLHQAADQSPEDETAVSRVPAVETEDEFVEVGIKMRA